MIWLHRSLWFGMAAVAFLFIPIIRAEGEVIEKMATARVYKDMSLLELTEHRI